TTARSLLFSNFSSSRLRAHSAVPSFPTRRSSDLLCGDIPRLGPLRHGDELHHRPRGKQRLWPCHRLFDRPHRRHACGGGPDAARDRKSTRLNSSHVKISYAVFCLKNKRAPESAAA